jgi:hypothetical protein
MRYKRKCQVKGRNKTMHDRGKIMGTVSVLREGRYNFKGMGAGYGFQTKILCRPLVPVPYLFFVNV